jgi:hypothetical protein
MNTPVLTKDVSLHEAEHQARCDLIDALGWIEIWIQSGPPTKAERELGEEFLQHMRAKYPQQKAARPQDKPEAEIARLTRERDEWAAVAAQRNRDRLAAADEPRAPQWDINSIERIARQQGVFGGRDGNTVTITGPIVIDGPSLEPGAK